MREAGNYRKLKAECDRLKRRPYMTGPDEHGSIYICVQPERKVTRGVVKRTLRIDRHLNVDYDSDGAIFGLELLGVPKRLEGK